MKTRSTFLDFGGGDFNSWVRLILPIAVSLTLISPMAPSSRSALAHEPGEPDEVFTGPPDITDNAPIETEFDVDDPEVEWYASRHGLSKERSLAIANWMTEIGPVIEGLDEALPEVFAEVRVVHGGELGDPALPLGDVRVEFRVTDAQVTEVRTVIDHIEEVNSRLRGASLVVLEVPKSLVQLRSEVAEAAKRDGSGFRYYFDFDRGSFDRDRAGRQPLISHDCTSFDSKKMEGGRGLALDPDGGGCTYPDGCTAGLAAYFNGRYGITTAGHCITESGWISNALSWSTDSFYINNPNNVYVSGWPDYADLPDEDDVMFIARRFNNTESPSRNWKYGPSEWRQTTHMERSSRALGLTICSSSSANSENGAGTYCGEVTDTAFNPNGLNPFFQRWTEVDFFDGQFPSFEGPGEGGSGSPMYWGGTSYGILTNCSPPTSTCRYGYYYQVRYMHEALEAASSDAMMLCDEDSNPTNMGQKCEPS